MKGVKESVDEVQHIICEENVNINENDCEPKKRGKKNSFADVIKKIPVVIVKPK